MYRINRDQAVELLEKAVLERGGEYVYQNEFGHACKNVADGKPACLIGLMLWRFFESKGFTDDNNPMLDYRQGTVISNAVRMKNRNLLHISKEALILLSVAQNTQDANETWGEAILRAQEVHYFMRRAAAEI